MSGVVSGVVSGVAIKELASSFVSRGRPHEVAITTHSDQRPKHTPQMLYFSSRDRTAPNGKTGFRVAVEMHFAIERFNYARSDKYTNIKKGPATRARALVRKWKKHGYRPTYASDRGCKFIAASSDADYGAMKNPYMRDIMQRLIKRQDAKRNQRLPSELMHRVLCVTNFNENDTDLALPGPASSTEIVSVAGTRALGYAPLIAPPSLIALEFKYEMGDKKDIAIVCD